MSGPAAWLARNAYASVLRLGTPAYLWRVWSRGREEPDYRLHWWERLGLYGADHRRALQQSHVRGGPLVWVHAVSLGEARAASALVQALRQQAPAMRLLLTHSTATGREAGKALMRPQQGDLQTWLPYDTPGAVRRFLRAHRPDLGVLMETEVWPVLQHQTARFGVPMVLANARLSDKSLRQGLRLSGLMRPAVQSLQTVLAQTESDAQRLRVMIDGAERPTLQVCGNVKFDMTPAPVQLLLGQGWRGAALPGQPARPIVLAASTREGEEAGLLQTWQEALSVARQVASAKDVAAAVPRLWIVPRHPQRFDEVAALVLSQGLRLSRRSQWTGGLPDAQALDADVWLGDSMGEMPAYFAAARVALLGGSFAPLGGQNLIEAAACGCPIVMGPSTFNFAEAAQLSEAAGAARRVDGWPQGVAVALAWSASPNHDDSVAQCLAFAQAHRGAAERMARLILAQVRRPLSI
ncbi:3-deoxy-D-manno-octulosonic acid transferase [Aquabacterium soli]|uniref:3-deoxy-D-manno-octulosonic acid transferase n=1 Tax=Aquabacterium soli TaxID=2493092 RepID=A0A426V754_9BURK|nr:3-deoxy-D-manno-octulosonic acid transferase [Aquabacterium soli]RRS02743.1 3-deoxy-D-manno-octulosonic acid transferase [Aquabacterium soli]